MPTPTQAPIALVDHAYKRLQVGLPYDEIVAEYWSSRPGWRAWEFLADTATILEEVPAPTDLHALGIPISERWEDVRLMRRLWPLTVA